MKTEPGLSSEFRAGALITISFIALLAMLFTVGSSQLFSKTKKISFLFNTIAGLEKNSPVYFAGHKVGKVSKIGIINEGQTKILVSAAVARDVRLKTDSVVYIDMLGFMGEKFIELSPGTAEAAVHPDNEPLTGIDPVPMAEMVKKGRQILEDLEKTNQMTESLVKDLKDLVGENHEELSGIVQNLNESSHNLKEMTQDLKTHPCKLIRKSGEKKKFGIF